MGNNKFLDRIFGKKSTTFAHAINSLVGVEESIANISMNAQDINFKSLEITKNFWTDLPKEVANGISCMALHIDNNYMSLLAYYQPNSSIKPHMHSNEWEVIKILEGSAYDETNDIQLNKGDVYVIPKGKVHNIITTDVECYLYTLFTSDKKYLKIPHSESDTAKNKILENLPTIYNNEINVLYIDDENTNLVIFDRMFSNKGINTFTAKNKKEYDKILEENEIHVLLCDYSMPEMNGTDTIKYIHTKYPKIIPIAVTAYYDKNVLEDLTNNAGVKTCLPKPWDKDVLLNSIKYSYSLYKKD